MCNAIVEHVAEVRQALLTCVVSQTRVNLHSKGACIRMSWTSSCMMEQSLCTVQWQGALQISVFLCATKQVEGVAHPTHLCRHSTLDLLGEECANVHCCFVEEACQSVIAALIVAFVIVDGIFDAELQGKHKASEYTTSVLRRMKQCIL